MRHRVKKLPKLNRKRAALKALLRNLVTDLILYEHIDTTESKAKAVQPIVEKLITTVKKKKDEHEAIRALQKVLFRKEASIKMIKEVKPRYEKRESGFTRITKIGIRKGDAAPLARIELIHEASAK